ncbi:uncharacterized protein N7483_002463 [Penicillium malachiteum]|uniref:uncharacterized protein n=1 Tax=Penicillium malachiteum TaxID=1324776 RepID=UPI00254725DE|nr:uncharacterized protein N7483_002463 [Penicillium malachiteum]KAJ5737338.1 hypothetical protein N7483_002463 [Penicillium malachiteum]
MVTNDRPAYIFDQSRYKYHTAVDIDRKEIIQACDVNGVAVHSRERTIRDLNDTDMIAGVNASNPFQKAQVVLDNPDADRLIGEMMISEKREFFWCYLHGLMHISGLEVTLFASCFCGPDLTIGRYGGWPLTTEEGHNVHINIS